MIESIGDAAGAALPRCFGVLAVVTAAAGVARGLVALAALNATICIAHVVFFWVAVAAYGPGEPAMRSSVMLPYDWDRVVKPVPAAVTTLADAPAPKIKSLGLVVVAKPLFNEVEDPLAAAVTSIGADRATPEYSWMYIMPKDLIALVKVAVTLSAPPFEFGT
jgi:hypothetical protein